MRIAIGTDHGGLIIKKNLPGFISALGHEVLDLGVYSEESVDFPDYAGKVCQAILDGKADRGILLCGSGVGVSIAANKFNGIYAAICHDTYSAHQGVEHDGMNVLCLGGRVIGIELAYEIIRSFLSANFVNEVRFIRRFEKVKLIERDNR